MSTTASPPSEQSPWLEALQDDSRLRKAEKDICWMRNIGLVGWLLVLQGHGYELGLTPVWAVYLGGVVYAAVAHWGARHFSSIRRLAVTTTFGDPVLAALICMFTGGIDSFLYPFFYFTQISVAIRFGVRESIGILVLHVCLTLVVFYAEPRLIAGDSGQTLLQLTTKMFLLGFAGFIGVIFAGWARAHAVLILEHARTLRESSARYQAVLRRFAQVQEDERRNIAGELHDRMSGHLFGLRQGIEQARRKRSDERQLDREFQLLERTVDDCTRDVRSIMNELQPTVLDELGLFEAASEYLARMSETLPFRLVTRMDKRLREWRSSQDAMLFRLLQEALLNVQKHAHAKVVEVALESDGQEVVLSVTDDGIGFDPTHIPIGHYGLMTMRERAESAGGRLTIESGPGARGTRIEVRLPGQ